MKYALFMILFCLCGYAQEAYVVQLSPADSIHSKVAFDRLQQAKKDWQAEEERISLKYLIVDPKDPEASSDHYSGQVISVLGITSARLITSGACLDSSGLAVDCRNGKPLPGPTKEEMARIDKEEKDRIARYDREKRQRRGFDNNCSNCLPKFEFSRDFKFIVPPKPEVKSTPGQYILGTGGSN